MSADRRFIAAPDLVVVEHGEGIVASVRSHGSRAELSSDFAEVLAFFRDPRTRAELFATYELDADVIDMLVRRHFVVAEDEVDLLRAGFLDERPVAVGARCGWADLPARASEGAWLVFGAPVDVAAGGEGGAKHGPTEIARSVPSWLRPGDDGERTAELVHVDLQRRYDLSDLKLLDIGDVRYAPHEPYEVFGRRVGKVVDEAHARGMKPLMLGGDHSVTWFALQRLLALHPRLGILHFDAHHDLHPTHDGQLRHLNPFVFACEHPSLAMLCQIGLRTAERPHSWAVPVIDPRIRCVSARDVARRTAEDVLADLPTDIPWYLTFDVDCMDPTVAPETGTPVLGGLTYRQGFDLVEAAARRLQIIGADFVEVNRGATRLNLAAHVCGAYLGALVLGRSPFTPLDTYFYRRS